jgi:hypothetical protein
MMRVCHLNTCPVGIATQDPYLRAKFAGQPEHVINYFFFVAEEVRQLMAELGVRRMDDLVGRASDFLDVDEAVRHWKARGVDLSRLLYREPAGPDVPIRQVDKQDHGLAGALDYQLIDQAKPASGRRPPRLFRAADPQLQPNGGHHAVRRDRQALWPRGLPDDTIQIVFEGSAGQSFGAFLAPGLSLTLHGDANDYVGKGMSGGRIVVRPPQGIRPSLTPRTT